MKRLLILYFVLFFTTSPIFTTHTYDDFYNPEEVLDALFREKFSEKELKGHKKNKLSKDDILCKLLKNKINGQKVKP